MHAMVITPSPPSHTCWQFNSSCHMTVFSKDYVCGLASKPVKCSACSFLPPSADSELISQFPFPLAERKRPQKHSWCLQELAGEQVKILFKTLTERRLYHECSV